MAVFDLGLLIVSLLTMIIVLFKTSKEKNPFLFSHAKQALNIITLMSFIMIFLVILCFLIWEVPQKILILDVICWFCNAALLIISLIASYNVLRGEEHTFAWLPKFY
jgi:uncharacterized Tic20 family protein